MAWDIDEVLTDIIFQYHLDAPYPRFRAGVKAQKCIRSLSESWGEGMVACISLGEDSIKTDLDAKQFRMSIDIEKENQVQFFSVTRKDFSLKEQYPRAYDFGQLKDVSWKSFSYVYIISNFGSHIVSHYLRHRNVEHELLYDFFSGEGIHDFTASREEYYDTFSHRIFTTVGSRDDKLLVPAVFEANRLLSELNGKTGNEQALLKRLFFCALHIRNFLLARETVMRLLNNYSSETNYQHAWDALQLLLRRIKASMTDKSDDIINLWIDCRNYHQCREQKYLRSLENNSLYFTNMITLTGFTSESLRTMFLGKKLLDDDIMSIKKIDEKNSPVLRTLSESDYEAKILGERLSNIFDSRYQVSVDPYSLLPASLMLWNLLRQHLLAAGRLFTVTHLLSETHTPRWCVSLTDRQVYGNYNSRVNTAFVELDRQVEFYMQFLSKTSVVLFNDHGLDEWWPRQHVLFAIKGEKHKPRKYEGLCSTVDYHVLIKMLAETGQVEEQKLKRHFVTIQGTNLRRLDVVSLKNTRHLVQASPAFQHYFKGYTGIVTDTHYYIFMGGREWIGERGKTPFLPRWFNCPEDICDEKLLPQFRRLAGTEHGMPMEITESRDFKNLCKVYDRAYERNQQKVELVNQFMSGISGKVALYGGDVSSREFYYMLNTIQREKISVIVDFSVCSCDCLGIPIVSLRDFLQEFSKSQGVSSVVIPPALTNKLNEFMDVYEKMKPDLRSDIRITVVDMNIFLKKRGFDYKAEFWLYEIRPEDFVNLDV